MMLQNCECKSTKLSETKDCWFRWWLVVSKELLGVSC